MNQLAELIEKLATEAVERAATRTLKDLLAGLNAPAKVVAPPKRKPVAKTPAPRKRRAKPPAPGLATEIGGGARSSNGGGTHVDVMTVQRYVEEHPGERCEQIKAGLGVEGAVVNRLLKSLVK